MRYVLIFVGALVVAYLLTMGIRAFIADRRRGYQSQQISRLNEDPRDEHPRA